MESSIANPPLKETKEEIEASPYRVYYSDGIYYLFGYAQDEIKIFRVDRITGICLLEDTVAGWKSFKEYDLECFSLKSFGMCGGKKSECVSVEIEFSNSLLDEVLDRFGKSSIIR